jgi:predicted HTH domain antitoxin
MSQIQSVFQGNAVTASLPGQLAQTCRSHKLDLAGDVRRYLAVLLYQNSLVSIGRVALLAGMERVAFEYFLSNNNIPLSNLSIDEVMNDAAAVIGDVKSNNNCRKKVGIGSLFTPFV